MGHKEIYTFSKEEIDLAKKRHFERTGEKWSVEKALEEWVNVNYPEIPMTNGMDYNINVRARKVTIIKEDC